MHDNNIEDERTSLLERPTVISRTIEIPPVVGRGCYGKLFPFGFWYEFKQLFRLAAPIACTSLINYSFGPISVMFCGQLGSFELATVGLAISIFNVTGLAVAMGLLTACDTLFAQVYGSSNFDKMGLNLQKSIILMTLCCFPCWSLHLLIEPILLTLKQNPLISKHAAVYLTYMIPCLLFAATGQIFTKYVQSQNQVTSALVIGILSNLLNALLHYLFLFVAKIGIRGSAIAQFLAYFTQTTLFVIYTKWHPMSKNTWLNYRRALFDDWGLWFRLAVPGLFMVTLEWTIFEIGSIVAGVLGERELAAQAIIYNIESLCYTLLPLGVGLAASIRVGHFLGAESSVGPRSVTSVSIVSICILALPMILIFVVLRFEIPRIFTQDQKVIDLAASLLPILAIFQLADCIVGVCSGIIRGAGLQYVGAIIGFVTLYVIGAPMGLGMIFVSGYGIEGLWWGLCTGVMLSAAIYLVTCNRLNWEKQVHLTMERVNPSKMLTHGNQHFGSNKTQSEDNYTETSDAEFGALLRADCSKSVAHSESYQETAPKRWKTNGAQALRFLIISIVLLGFIVCLVCRVQLNWANYFGIYCVYSNGSFVNFQNDTQLQGFLNDTLYAGNCTVMIP